MSSARIPPPRESGMSPPGLARTAGVAGGYSFLKVVAEGAIVRELQRLAEEFNGGEAFPPNTEKFRADRPSAAGGTRYLFEASRGMSAEVGRRPGASHWEPARPGTVLVQLAGVIAVGEHPPGFEEYPTQEVRELYVSCWIAQGFTAALEVQSLVTAGIHDAVIAADAVQAGTSGGDRSSHRGTPRRPDPSRNRR